MTQGPVQLDVGVSYGLPRKGLPAAASINDGRAARALDLPDAQTGPAIAQPGAAEELLAPVDRPGLAQGTVSRIRVLQERQVDERRHRLARRHQPSTSKASMRLTGQGPVSRLPRL